MKTQHERIISYLKAHRRAGITSLEAVIKLGIINLPGRISEIRADEWVLGGPKIQHKREKVTNCYGQTVTVNRYWLA